jgi:hypothetical protein
MNPARSKISLLLCVTGALLVGTASAAGDNAQQKYREDRAACMSGQSHQDRQTCLREAGAALQESRRGGLKTDEASLSRNQLERCNAFTGQDRALCERRMREGTVSGSVEGGGVLRELVVTVPADQAR